MVTNRLRRLCPNSICFRPTTALFPLVLAIFVFAGRPLCGQERYEAKINVDAEKVRNVMGFRALAVDSTPWDNNLTSPETAQLLRAIGVTTVRFPGNFANRYHWSTHKSTPMRRSDPSKGESFSPATGFGQFTQMLDKLGGTAIVTVNYGTNLAGSGGGEPAEAAAWVAYANGDPSDNKIIGKDSTGYDWKTVGYWAGIRAASPLPADDGFNFLRVSHPQPLKIKYWEIGNEVFNNGYYMKGGKNNVEEDLHAPYGGNEKEDEKTRSRNSKLSPATYGNAIVEFAKAMKAVDPTVKIGAALVPPPIKGSFTQPGAQIEHWNQADDNKRLAGGGGWLTGVAEACHSDDKTTCNISFDNAQDWNSGVMKACAKMIDFVVIHWQLSKFRPPDYKTVDATGTLVAPYSELPQVVNGLLELFNRYGGSNAANLQLAVTGLSAFGTEKEPLVQSLFLAETYMSLIETGSVTTVGVEAHGQGFLDAANKPGPLAYALGMIHILAKPNDPVLQSESSNPLVAVHTVKRADGSLGLMLINKDANKTASVRVTLKGAKAGNKAIRFDFGKNTNGLPVKSALETGDTFTVDVPPQTITDLLIPKAS